MSDTLTGDQFVEARTVLRFSFDDDHCVYYPDRILRSLGADAEVLTSVFGDDMGHWTTSEALYCAVEELEERGHVSLAGQLEQCLHEENVYGCLCTNDAFDKFTAKVGSLFSAIEARHPDATWWTGHELMAYGLYFDVLLDRTEWDQPRGGEILLEVDDAGNGFLRTNTGTVHVTAFATKALGTFTRRMDGGDVTDDAGDLVDVDDFLTLPAELQEMMATLYQHDAQFAVEGLLQLQTPRRAMDLSFGDLKRVATGILGLPDQLPSVVLTLLPGTEGTVEDLLTAIEAATAGT